MQCQLSDFFDRLSTCTGAKPAILALVPPHCDDYVPTSLAPELPNVLSDLYQAEFLKLGYHELLQKAHSIDTTVTSNQALAVEAKTKNQIRLVHDYGSVCVQEESLHPSSKLFVELILPLLP